MAERTADQQRKKRQKARERRRSLTSEPFEKLDQAARSDGGSGPSRDAVKQTLATAAAGAVAAGIAGAAKALHDRQADDSGNEPAEGRDDEGNGVDQDDVNPEPQATEASPDEGPPEEEPQADEPQSDEAQPDEPQADEPQDAGGEPSGDPEEESDGEPRQGVPAGDAKKIVDAARRQLEEILGLEPESVSGFERNGDGWAVTVEVVEMHRIPESTDVLSSYEVTVDDDGNVIGASQRRRYRRSQVEDEG
jgi:Gas vesicle synthesis protein GvpO